jgi:hypothetical protein
LIDQPEGEWYTRKTWLSGMSPVAAVAASPWSAPGALEAAAVVAGGAAVGLDVEGAALLPPPQPATARAAGTTAMRIGKRVFTT